jgi:tRNA(Ile)-lysidine synthase
LPDEKIEISNDTSEIFHPIHLTFKTVDKIEISTNKSISINADLLKYPLSLRKRKEGDYFFPFGMNGKKKISKFYKDEKMSLLDKENCWLLCDATDSVVWVVGKRTDNRFAVNETTNRILNIKIN